MRNSNSSKPDAVSYSALTNKQRQLWLGQQLYGSLPIYNLPLTFTIHGELKVQHFQNAFQALIKSCDVFRTLIEDIDGVPRLKVLSHFPYTMEFCDLSQHPDPEHAAQAWIQPRIQHVFKLNECLFESALIKLTTTKWIWFYNVHHIISDGLTLSLMVHRMSEFYGHSLDASPKEQVAQPQYQNYVEWEADFFQTDRHQKGKDFWASKLRQHSEPLQLYGRTMGSQLVPINRVTYPLDDKITQAIYRLASSDLDAGLPKPAAIFEILAAVFMTYLHRISGQRHLSMGIPFHNRPAGPFKTTLGLFVEIAPLCIDIANTETFETLRKKIRREVQAMMRHVRSVPEYTLQHRPYHVMFNYHLGTFPDFYGMPTIMQWHHAGMANVGLNLHVQDFNRSGTFTLGYDINAELFDEKQQHRMLQHTLQVLQAFLKDPSQRLNAFSMLSDEEEHLVLHKFNQPPNRIALNQTNEGLLQTGQCVHHLIEAQMAQTPEAVALVSEDQQLTYAELNVRTNQLAYYLQKHGVGPEVPVGLCVDRSLEMVIGLLGILKAGGAYAPLDPNYPQERLAFIAKDADLPVIITKEKFQEHLSPLGIEHIRLDADWPVIGKQEESTPVSGVRADSLAYVIFTSGSTGRPKGVEVEHRQVVNYVEGILERLKVPAGSSFATVSPLTADLGNTMLYPALATGGTLHIISEDRATDSVALGEYFQHHQPDCLKIVPSHLASLLMGPTPAEVLPQKRLVLGGEPCPWHLVEKVQALKPGCKVINHYGPTETTVGVTTYQVEATDRTTSHSPSVPIGRPLPNSQLYILDSHKNIVPLGVAGEVYIGGRGLARGYAGAPELTAEKFVPHPYSEEPGARLYKTGDRAKFLPDGTIEFLGRIDHQVKLRGFRIELGEIETVLNQHNKVQAAVVVVREDEPGNKRLVAYVVADGLHSPAVMYLRAFVRSKLPDHMLPSAFMVLDRLPLTANGKLDRRALPPPGDMHRQNEAEYTPPRTELEEQLTQIWAEVLKLERVGVHDNYFDMGGHSLLLTQIVSQMRTAMSIELPLSEMFNYPTVAELATKIDLVRWTSGEDLEDESEEDEVFIL